MSEIKAPWTATSYSDPRMTATVEDWPLGRDKRGVAFFEVEITPKRGQRVSRTTTGKPVRTTYATKARIVTGDDGCTYIAELTMYGFVSMMRGDMKYQHEAIYENDPRYVAVRALFD